MEQMTLKRLANHLNKLLKDNPSLANKYIVVGDDNEGNGYHGLFYGITHGEQAKECIEFSNGLYDSQCEDLDQIVILG